MKTLLHTLFLILCLTQVNASVLRLNGDLSWEITEPRCTFKMDGGIQNISPSSTTSGTIKLVLWVTKAPYPSTGVIAAEYTLGQISGGYQFSDFTVKTTSNIPNVTGEYNFAISVLEYTTAGWQNRLIVKTGTKNLVAGDFKGQQKWTIPSAAVVAPPAALKKGNRVLLNLKASSLFNLFPASSQITTTVAMDTKTTASVNAGSGKKAAIYQYTVKNAKLNGKAYKAGNLYIDYKNSSSYANITLFYQAADAGTYKSVETVSGKKETTWGTFTAR